MKKILVLEDEPNIRSFVVINLRRSGYEPLEAENSCDPDYILNGVELWYDDLDLVPDNYGEESEDE